MRLLTVVLLSSGFLAACVNRHGSSGPATTNTTVATGTYKSTPGPAQDHAPTVAVPGGAGPGLGSFNGVACPSTSRCWAAGADTTGNAVVALSTDGAATWSTQSLPSGIPELDAITCADTSHCVAVGQGAIVSTNDGGASWSLSKPPTAETTLLGVSCSSAISCFSSGVVPNRFGPLRAVLLSSADGGASWKQLSLPPYALGLGDVTCPTTTLCIAVGESIWVSNDAGATWHQASEPGVNAALRSVSCSSPTHCVAVGPNPLGVQDAKKPANAVVTSDGGATWSLESWPASTAGVSHLACAASTSQCIAGGPGPSLTSPAEYVSSADGGDNWAASSPPPGMNQVAGLACPALNHCVAVGLSGGQAISAQTTNGTSWVTHTVSGA